MSKKAFLNSSVAMALVGGNTQHYPQAPSDMLQVVKLVDQLQKSGVVPASDQASNASLPREAATKEIV